MAEKMVDPSGVPDFTGNLEQLEKDAKGLKGDAGKIRGTGADTHAEFQGLAAYYSAPEAEQLFATTKPVKDRADQFADDAETVASALDSHAATMRPLVAKLKRLKGEAVAFVESVSGDDEWKYDEDKVDRNNQLIQDISATVAAIWAAERDTANKITALWGGTHWVAGDGSGAKNMYGFSAEEMKKAGKTPWGEVVKEKHHWYEIGHWAKSFLWDGLIVDGIWGTLKGLGTLVGFQGLDAMGQAWKGLGQLATYAALTAVPGAMLATRLLPDGAVKDWVNQSKKTALAVGKSLVAWDMWSKNPARAAGLLTFNVITTVATGGAGAVTKVGSAGKVAAAAGKVGNVAGKVGKFLDPMTYIGKGAGAALGKLPNMGQMMSGLSNLTTIEVPQFPDGAVRMPDGQTIPAGSPLPELPPGANAAGLPDGSVRLPDGSTLQMDGSLDSPAGQRVQEGNEAPVETPAETVPGGSTVPEPELATVGGRNTDEITAHADNNGPSPGNNGSGGGDNTPSSPHGSTTGSPSGGGSHTPPSNSTPGPGGNSGPSSPHGGSSPSGGGHPPGGNAPGSGGGTGGGNSPSGDAGNGGATRGTSDAGGGNSGSPENSPADSRDDAINDSSGNSGDEVPGGADDSGQVAPPGEQGSGGGANETATPPQVADDAVGHEKAATPSGPMTPDQESAVSAELADQGLKPVDQERILTQLRKSPFGERAAELISRGHLSDVQGYDEVLKMFKDKTMNEAATMALEHATTLHNHGIPTDRLAFEIKNDATGLDLDVATLHPDGTMGYGYQLKDVNSIEGINSAVKKSAKQLMPDGADVKVAVLDIHQPTSGLTDAIRAKVAAAAERSGAVYHLRFNDGSVTIPANASVYP